MYAKQRFTKSIFDNVIEKESCLNFFFPFSVYLDEEDNCLLNIYDLKNMRNNYLTGVFKKQKLKYFVFNSDLQ